MLAPGVCGDICPLCSVDTDWPRHLQAAWWGGLPAISPPPTITAAVTSRVPGTPGIALLSWVLWDTGMFWPQPRARLILENPAWGLCRLQAVALPVHGGMPLWAQLLTFLSGDKSLPCEQPLCGECCSSSLQPRVPSSAAVLVLRAA